MKKRIFIIFLGLFLFVGCSGNTTTLMPTTESETVYHLVQFLGFDGSVISVQEVVDGEDALPPIAPLVPGYIFIDWEMDFTNVTSDLIISSNYQITQVTVVFDSSEGSVVSEIVLDYGSAITLPTPLRSGYNFLGWFLSEDINSPRVFDGDRVYENITLIARWERMIKTTVYTEEQLFLALAEEICEEIHFGADIEVNETIVITRGLKIYGNGYKLIPLGIDETFRVEQEAMSSPRKVDDIERVNLNIYDLELVYEFDERVTPNVFELYEIGYYDILLDNVEIKGDIQDAFKVHYSRYINISISGSEISVLGKAFDANDGIELTLNIEKSDIEAGTILFLNDLNYSRFDIKESNLTMIGSNTEEHLALFVIDNSGEIDLNTSNSNIYSEMVTTSYIASATNEGDNLWLGFNGCNIEINSAVFEDLFTKTSLFTHYDLDGSTLILKEGITSIPDYGFSNAADFTNIILPSSLESIGDYAFESCQGLTKIIIPEGVSTIGEGAFRFCYGLTSVVIPETTLNVGSQAFTGNSLLLEIFILEGVDQTNWDNDWNLEEVDVVSDVQYLQTVGGIIYLVLSDDSAIIIDYIYEGLSEIVIPQSITIEGVSYDVTKIGKLAFENNSTLTSITIPNTITKIDYAAFRDNLVLETVNFEDNSNLEIIGEEVFAYCLSLVDITIPSSVAQMGGYVFFNNYRLENVVFEAGSMLTEIPTNAFAFNERLVSITIPASVTIIDSHAFYACGNLSEVNFESGSILENINGYAFYGAYNLTSFTLPESVSYIGVEAFYQASSLAEFIIPVNSELTAIDGNAFGYSGLEHISLPEGLTSIGIYAFSNCLHLTEINIPALITQISDFTFYNDSALTTVTFSSGSLLESIQYNVFFNNYALSEIVLPDSVTYIGARSFYNCASLTTINIPEQLEIINTEAFAYCINLVSFSYSEVNSLTTIYDRAFKDCNVLVEFFIPDTVTYLGSEIFSYAYYVTINIEAVSEPISWSTTWASNSSWWINFAVNHRTITLELNNGEPMIEIFEKMDTVLIEPTDPTRAGYIFDGWYLDDGSFLEPYTFTVMPEEDMTVYAKWVPIP